MHAHRWISERRVMRRSLRLSDYIYEIINGLSLIHHIPDGLQNLLYPSVPHVGHQQEIYNLQLRLVLPLKNSGGRRRGCQVPVRWKNLQKSSIIWSWLKTKNRLQLKKVYTMIVEEMTERAATRGSRCLMTRTFHYLNWNFWKSKSMKILLFRYVH